MRTWWVVLGVIALARVASARPVLSGGELTRASADGHVRLHYTLTGADAVDAADVAPANGVPDAVDAAEDGLARMWAAFVDGDGWPAPAADGGVGGDDRLDVYVRELGPNGLASVDGAACFIELDRGAAALGMGVLASIAGHELHHCLQFAVATGLSPWIYEATATFAQYVLFDGDPQVALARNFHWQSRLAGGHLAMDTVGNQFEYAGMVWIKFLLDRAGGDRAALLALWRAMAAAGTWEAGHDAFLAPGSLDDAAAEYAVWAWFACANDDGHHFDPTTIPCGVPATVMAATTPSGTSISIGRRGAAYVRLDPDGRTTDLALTLRPHAAMRLDVIEWTAGASSPLQSWTGGAGDTWEVTVGDWNQLRAVVVVATALVDGATFAWETPPPDPGPDAGADAAPDAGAALDAGGGGCGCRAPAADGGTLVLLALLLPLTRRRCTGSRTWSGSRCRRRRCTPGCSPPGIRSRRSSWSWRRSAR